MTALLAILQGAGCSAAIGVRPFLPALLVGVLASADLGVDFDGTDFAFLESIPFLVAMGVLFVLTTAVKAPFETPPGRYVLAGIAVVLGGLEAAGALDDVSDTWWPALLVGLAAAGLGLVASSGLLGRVAGRLDADAAGMLVLYAEAFALVLAGLTVLAPPVAVLGIGLLAWLLVGGRRREGEKYAGLRSLR